MARLNQQAAEVAPTANTEGRMSGASPLDGFLSAATVLAGGAQQLLQQRARDAKLAQAADVDARTGAANAEALRVATGVQLAFAADAGEDELASVIAGIREDTGVDLTPAQQKVLDDARGIAKLAQRMRDQGAGDEAAINLVVQSRLQRLTAGNEDIADAIVGLATKNWGSNFSKLDQLALDDQKARQTAQREAIDRSRQELVKFGVVPVGTQLSDSEIAMLDVKYLAPKRATLANWQQERDLLQAQAAAGEAGADIRLRQFLENSGEQQADLFRLAMDTAMNEVDPVRRASQLAQLEQESVQALLGRGISPNDPQVSFVRETIARAAAIDPTAIRSDRERQIADTVQARVSTLQAQERYRQVTVSPNLLSLSVFSDLTQYVPRVLSDSAVLRNFDVMAEVGMILATNGGAGVQYLPAKADLQQPGKIGRVKTDEAVQKVSAVIRGAPTVLDITGKMADPDAQVSYLNSVAKVLDEATKLGNPRVTGTAFKDLASPEFGKFMSGSTADVPQAITTTLTELGAETLDEARGRVWGAYAQYEPQFTVDGSGRIGLKFNKPSGKTGGAGILGGSAAGGPVLGREVRELLDYGLPAVVKATSHIASRSADPKTYAQYAQRAAAFLNTPPGTN